MSVGLNTIRLSIVLPGYNERPSLHAAVESYQAAMRELDIEDYELLVVDDGSTDGMGEEARRLSEGDERVRLLTHERNQGQVAAILTGFRAARGEWVTHNGMDLPLAPRDSALALQFADRADVVVVERIDRQSYGAARKILSWGNRLLIRLLFGASLRDHNFVQFYRREVLETLRVRSRGVSTVTVELILRAQRRGLRVVGVRADYHRRQAGRSTITARKVVRSLLETIRLRWLL